MKKKYRDLGPADKNDDGIYSVDELVEIAKSERPVEGASQAHKEELVDFDTWFSLRENQIPARHRKEIIRADFRAQKVEEMATMDSFDKALKKYGVKLA